MSKQSKQKEINFDKCKFYFKKKPKANTVIGTAVHSPIVCCVSMENKKDVAKLLISVTQGMNVLLE